MSGTGTLQVTNPMVVAACGNLAVLPGGGRAIRLSVWRPGSGGSGWAPLQTITVPIQYGSLS